MPQHLLDSIVKVSRGRLYLLPAGQGITGRSTPPNPASQGHGGLLCKSRALLPQDVSPRGHTPPRDQATLPLLHQDDPASRENRSWNRRRRRPLALCKQPKGKIFRPSFESFQVSSSPPGQRDSK